MNTTAAHTTPLALYPPTLTVEEAASVLRIGRSAAYQAIRTGSIPSIRLGNTIRVPRHLLERMLEQATEVEEGAA